MLRGGTFYQDNDPTGFRSSESSNEFSYYNKNGHGRPQTAAYVQRYTYPEDQFANFRDFADINTPNEPAFSHFVVVYRNRNGTEVVRENGEEEVVEESQANKKYEPRNILDQLRLLDEEKLANAKNSKSKSKAKLKRTKLGKTYTKHVHPKNDYQVDDGYNAEVDEMVAGDDAEGSPLFEDVLQANTQRVEAETKEPVDPLLALS